jgi:hypothetical protein
MSQIGIRERIEQAIIYAFTLAVALIWKDVILDIIEVIVPAKEELLAKIFTAIIATIFVIVIIFLFLRTESQAESVLKKIKKPS